MNIKKLKHSLLVFILLLLSTKIYAHSGTHFSRSMLVIFENTNYKDVMRQDYFLKLANQGANFTHMSALIHPSQGNYIALTSGSLNGVTNDRVHDVNAKNIVDRLEQKGVTWKVYAEDYPGNCFKGKSSNNYVRKHNPFISYLNVQKNRERCSHIVNAREFFQDQKNNDLPQFIFYVPDMKHDAHDTDIQYANNWYKKTFQNLFRDPNFLDDAIVITTFDESNFFSLKNQIYTSIIGSNIIPGQYSTPLNTYSILKLFEDNWELGYLTQNDKDAVSFPDIWK